MDKINTIKKPIIKGFSKGASFITDKINKSNKQTATKRKQSNDYVLQLKDKERNKSND